MKCSAIELRDMGPFGHVKIRFADLGGPLVAVTGPNGQGKTILLELLGGGVIYRRCPTRGTLSSLATSRNAFVEGQYEVGGRRFTIRQSVDAISGKGEALVLDEAGKPVLDGTSVRRFDDWAARVFVAAEVTYSSSVAVQGERGLLDLKPADRKKVLIRVLGLERVERMADAARKRAGVAKAEAEKLRAQLGELPELDLNALAQAIVDATAAAELAEGRLQVARVALDTARAAAADAERAREVAAQRGRAMQQVEQARAKLWQTDERIKNNRTILARAEEIRAAVAATERLRTELKASEAKLGAAREAFATAKSEHEAHARAVAKAAEAVTAATGRMQRAEARLRDRAKVTEAIAAVPVLKARESEAVTAVQDLERNIGELERLLLQGKDERIAGLRVALVDVAASTEPDFMLHAVESAHRVAVDAVKTDDELAVRHGAAPTEIEAARAALVAKRREREALRTQVSDAERLAARLPEIEQAQADAVAAAEDLAVAKSAHALEQAAGARTATTVRDHDTAVTAATRACGELQRQIEALASDAAYAEKLAAAEGRLVELAGDRERDAAALATAETDLARYPDIKPGASNVQDQVTAFEAAERAVRECAAAKARAEQTHEQAEEVQARREFLERDLGIASNDLADWTRLGQDLGRDGLQALEIDCAIPELNELTGSLLRSCHGPRFTVTLSTQRLTADGDRNTEELDVRVLDTENGRDDLAETYSGGECVIVGEAVALALTTLACRRAGIERPIIIRDESGAALDPSNARAYIKMLRKAAEELNAERVLFVAHDPELQELADARLDVGTLSDQSNDQLELATHEPPAVASPSEAAHA